MAYIMIVVMFGLISSSITLPSHSNATTSISIPLFSSLYLNRTTRIVRDIARVNWLTANVIQPNRLDTPIMSGISYGTGEYFAPVGIGSPVNSFLLTIDTGSDITWTQCQPCVNCYSQVDTIFDPSLSTSYQPLPCDRRLPCSGCSNARTCQYRVKYGDGSFMAGDLATETLTFGTQPIITYPMGCGHDNQGLNGGSAGILGLGGGKLALPYLIQTTKFSYCLVPHGSAAESTIDFDVAHTEGEWIYAPLFRNPFIPTFYYVGLVGFQVGGETIDIPPTIFEIDDKGKGGVIVDSGTVVTRLPTVAYNALRDAFLAKSIDLGPVESISIFDTCFGFSNVAKVPIVSFMFAGGGTLSLQPFQSLIEFVDDGKHCFAFAPSTEQISIMGNTQQQSIRVMFSFVTGRIGFSPNAC